MFQARRIISQVKLRESVVRFGETLNSAKRADSGLTASEPVAI